ncbi:MAG: hypothetical protein COA71_14620 [SAR86 cluster bacterium]|uniref:Uncharacterized protein n=1 Tax=SAR86 cluster bacterium TaxID=2030880 RepID=A0A2A5C6S7_9GAMM|nr:MAG: hypothetical protein COA71_14620 [SAR86 cluster bacterium]
MLRVIVLVVVFFCQPIFSATTIAAENNELFTLEQSLPVVISHKINFETLFGQNNDPTTLRPLYEEYIDLIGLNGIFDVIEAQACHAEGHELGKVIYSRLNDFSASIHTCQNNCTSGCFHGILMELFTSGDEHLALEDVSVQMNNLCNSGEINQYFNIGTCYHGMGHAMMFLSDYSIDETLELCAFAPTETLNYFCITGGFMEYELIVGQSDMQTSAHFPCNSMAKYSAACYRYKMNHILVAAAAESKSTFDIINECIALPSRHRLGCFHGLGTAFINATMAEPDLLSKLCIIGNANDRRMCIEGAMWKVADFDVETANEVCSFFPVGSRDSDVCFNAVDEGMYSLETDYSLYF